VTAWYANAPSARNTTPAAAQPITLVGNPLTKSGALTCEIRDIGRFNQPLVDRERPNADLAGPRGLWLANQLCDLVQIRTFPNGTAIRLHMWLKQSADGQANGHHGHTIDLLTV
jgi:hypothetical protein